MNTALIHICARVTDQFKRSKARTCFCQCGLACGGKLRNASRVSEPASFVQGTPQILVRASASVLDTLEAAALPEPPWRLSAVPGLCWYAHQHPQGDHYCCASLGLLSRALSGEGRLTLQSWG